MCVERSRIPLTRGIVTIRTAVAAVLMMAVPGGAAAQEPSVTSVLARAATYVADFQRQLSGIVAEETYEQDAKRLSSMLGSRFPRQEEQHRELKSDLLLVRPIGADSYVEFRDVFEVDGTSVRDRQNRLTSLFLTGSPSATNEMERIVAESARYNIGDIERTINTPTLPLLFLNGSMQHGFKFNRAADGAPAMARGAAKSGDRTSASFTVSTEVWVVEYQEVQRPTLIRTTTGQNLPARGRFWIEPATGRVLMSELIAEDGQVRALIDVSYQSEPIVGFFVPIEMRERYEGRVDGSLIEGTAVYGKFRQFQVTVEENIPPVKDDSQTAKP